MFVVGDSTISAGLTLRNIFGKKEIYNMFLKSTLKN